MLSARRRLAPARARTILAAAGLLMAISFLFPYWLVEVRSPVHPEGRRLAAYLGHLEGAPPGAGLEDVELSQKVAGATVLALLIASAAGAGRRWAALFGLPAIVFPLAVAADLRGNLPRALCALGEQELGCAGRSPPLWGSLEVAGHHLATWPGGGILLASLAAIALAAGLCQILAPSRFSPSAKS